MACGICGATGHNRRTCSDSVTRSGSENAKKSVVSKASGDTILGTRQFSTTITRGDFTNKENKKDINAIDRLLELHLKRDNPKKIVPKEEKVASVRNDKTSSEQK